MRTDAGTVARGRARRRARRRATRWTRSEGNVWGGLGRILGLDASRGEALGAERPDVGPEFGHVLGEVDRLPGSIRGLSMSAPGLPVRSAGSVIRHVVWPWLVPSLVTVSVIASPAPSARPRPRWPGTAQRPGPRDGRRTRGRRLTRMIPMTRCRGPARRTSRAARADCTVRTDRHRSAPGRRIGRRRGSVPAVRRRGASGVSRLARGSGGSRRKGATNGPLRSRGRSPHQLGCGP